MSWITLTILSACILGIYDLVRKTAVSHNAVPAVLWISVGTAALVWLPFLILSHTAQEWLPHPLLLVSPVSWEDHGFLLLKSTIVSCSWTFAYVAIKHLPITIAAPIRSTSPIWTILLALTFLGESPTPYQWIGIVTIMGGFYGFSLAGKLEGIHFQKNRWVFYMMIAAVVAGGSSFYDRWLFDRRELSAATVQCWFSIYLVVILSPFFLAWKWGKLGASSFHWRWSIPLSGLCLLGADFLYFTALTDEDALISVVSPIRRTAIVVTFIGGAIFFKEKHVGRKAIFLAVLLIGVLILEWAK